MALELLSGPVGEDAVDRVPRETPAVSEVVHRRLARHLPMGIYLHCRRVLMPVGGLDLNTEEVAVRDFPDWISR